MRKKKKRPDEPCVLLLEDAFGGTEHPETLRNAGFVVECFRDYFPAKPGKLGKPEQSVKDPRIIRLCEERSFVLITTDKNLCYTHAETVKKTSIVVIATESNRDHIKIWVDALIKGKARIERLVKNTQKYQERPCCARISRTGKLTVDEKLKDRITRRNRPREGQEK